MKLPTLADVGDSIRLEWTDPIFVCHRSRLRRLQQPVPDIPVVDTSYCQQKTKLCSIFSIE